MQNLNLQKLQEIIGRKDRPYEVHYPGFKGADTTQVKITNIAMWIPDLFFCVGREGDNEDIFTSYTVLLARMVQVSKELERTEPLPPMIKEENLFQQFQTLMVEAAVFQWEDRYITVWSLLLGLGELLGFTAEEVETAFVRRYGGGAA